MTTPNLKSIPLSKKEVSDFFKNINSEVNKRAQEKEARIQMLASMPPLDQENYKYVSQRHFVSLFGPYETYRDTLECAELTLMKAIEFHDLDIFSHILNSNIGFNADTIIQATGQSLCQTALKWRDYDILTFLLDKNPDLYYCTPQHLPLLHQAIQVQNLEVVQLLLNKNIDVNALDSAGMACVYSIRYHYFEDPSLNTILQLIFDAGFHEDLLYQGSKSFFRHCTEQCMGRGLDYLISKVERIDLLTRFQEDLIMLKNSPHASSYDENLEALTQAVEEKLRAYREKKIFETEIMPENDKANAHKKIVAHKI